MKLAIASSDDLVGLYATYIQLIERDEDTSLELTFAPGVYGVASIGPVGLDLGGNPPPKQPKVDIVLRGDPAQPVVFRDMAVRICARSVHLENVVMTGRQQGLLDARVASSLSMRNCVVAHNTWGGPWGGALLRVAGTYGQPAYSVTVEDTWFVGNAEQSRSALLALAPATGSYIERVNLARVTFLANRNAADVDVQEARTIHLDDVLAVKEHADGAVLRYSRAQHVLVEGSTFVVDDPRAIADETITTNWSSGLELRASRVYASGASRALPACVRGRVDVHEVRPPDRSALDAIGSTIASGLPNSRAAARERLRDVLGVS